jgi:hypothetical protein
VPLRLIEIFASPDHEDKLATIAEDFDALNFWTEARPAEATQSYRIVARSEKQQELIDGLQGALGKGKPWRITIMTIEATIPELEQPEPEQRSRADDARGALRRDRPRIPDHRHVPPACRPLDDRGGDRALQE